jgi:hypothetical protein
VSGGVICTQIESFTQLFQYSSPVKKEYNYTPDYREEHNMGSICKRYTPKMYASRKLISRSIRKM